MRKIFKVMTIVIVSVFCFASCNNCKDNTPTAKYIFYFIGDGMGNTHVALTESYLSYKEGKLGGAMLTMSQFPYFGMATTYSANDYVTDSSAAGTAIASGEKTNNYTLGVDPEGKPVKSMAYDLQEDGYNIGIVTTVPVNHATPGAFYASSASREDYYDISKQILKSEFEFFAGSGFLDFKGKTEECIQIYGKVGIFSAVARPVVEVRSVGNSCNCKHGYYDKEYPAGLLLILAAE
mgnify:CR=1 FL=1